MRGYDPMQAGLLSLPLAAGMMVGSAVAGRVIAETGRYKVFPIAGAAVMSLGSFLFAQVAWNSPLWQPLTAMAIIGLGLGGCMQTLVLAVQNASPRGDMGASTAAATFARQIGGTLGVAASFDPVQHAERQHSPGRRQHGDAVDSDRRIGHHAGLLVPVPSPDRASPAVSHGLR